MNPGMQHSMAGARIREAGTTGASAIVTPCQTCSMGLQYGVEEISSAMKVYHLNEMLIRSICPEVSSEEIQARLQP